MPSLFNLTFLTLAFPGLLCYALKLPLESRDKKVDWLRSLPRCQNEGYEYYPAGLLIPPVAAGELEGPPEPDGAPTTPSDSSQPLILCAPSTETYIKLTIKPTNVNHALGGNDQEIAEDLGGLIGNSWTYITRQYLIAGKNGVINKGEGIIWQKISTHGHFILQVANAHHWKPVPKWGGHGTMKIVGNEVTWAVLRAGLTALGTHFQETNVWSECSFEIWDGFNQVGTAMVRGCYESCE